MGIFDVYNVYVIFVFPSSFVPKSRVASVASNEVRHCIYPMMVEIWTNPNSRLDQILLLTISKAPTKSAENAFPFGQLLQEVAQVAMQS